MNEEETLYHEIGQHFENAEQSQMFGKPCYKINGKAFVCFFQNAMVFKLTGEAHQNALSLDGAQLFDPSGKKRPMKAWVQIPFEYRGMWDELAASAVDFVGGL